MENMSLGRKLGIFFITTVFVLVISLVVGHALLPNSVNQPKFALDATVVGSVASAVFTSLYYVIILFVRWIHKNHGAEGEKKLRYILTGSLLFNLMPVFSPVFWMFGLWFLLPVYSWPVRAVESLLNINVSPLVVTIPFWVIVGGIIGCLLFRLEQFARRNTA